MSDQTEEDVSLLPCAFCGSTAAPQILSSREIEEFGDCDCDCHDHADHNFAVCCCFNSGGCGAVGGFDVRREKAAEKWNRRVS